MSDVAAFASIPITAAIKTSETNPHLDPTGYMETLITAGPAGLRVDSINIIIGDDSVGYPSDTCVAMFLHNGSSAFLYKVIYPLSQLDPESTQLVEFELRDLAIVLENGWSLRFCPNGGGPFHISTTFAARFG